jgi:O-antigen/teichoic acid export membrane protein
MNPAWIRYLPSFLRQRLEGRHSLQKAIHNAGWLMGGQVFRLAIGLVVGIWVARYLGPSRFGQLSYAFAFTLLFSPFASLGLKGIAERKIVLDPSSRDEVIGTSFFLSLVGGIAAFAVATAGVFMIRPEDAMSHWLVGITAAGLIFQSVIAIEYWFESQVQSKFIVFAKMSAFLLVSLVKIGLIVTKAPLVAFAWAGLAEAALGAAGLLIVYRVHGYHVKAWRFSRSAAKSLLKDSWPLLFSGFMTVISLRIDQVMLGQMVGDREVGIYSAAVRLTEPWVFIPTAIGASVFPAIMESWATNEELFYAQIQKLYNLMALIAYGIAVPVSILSGWLVKGLFGTPYAEAGPLLAVLIWTGLFTNLEAARGIFLVSMNWTRVYFLTLLSGCVLNIVLNYFLIPIYGAMGAVIASCISYWFALHGACFFFKPLRKTGWMLAKAMVYPRVW